jgi:hypothetical protein
VSYATDMADGMDALYSIGGVKAIYNDQDGNPTNVTAIIEHDLEQYGTVAEVAGKVAAISVRVSELKYKPRRAETYTIDGTVYTVDSILRADELEHVALVA